MKEIDFDELDRAVNSLMKTVPAAATDKAGANQEESEETVITIGESNEPPGNELMKELVPTSTSDVSPVYSEVSEVQADEPEPESMPEPASIPASTPVRPEISSAPAPRRGRFMDMVRPNVRDAKKMAPSGAASRQGVTLQPMSASLDTPDIVADDSAAAEQPESTSAQSDASVFAQSFEAFDADAVSPETTADTAPVAEEAPVEDITPLSSPFLPDAKVEKRPLGRAADAAPVVDLAAELNESIEAATEQPAVSFEDAISPNKDAQLPEQPLPAELGDELLSIETSTENFPSEPQLQPEATAPVAAPTVVAPQQYAPEPVRPIEMTSIPQQYKVQPQTSEAAPTGTIYDTQPLAHPAQKKPGWLWIVAILAILIIGAALGAAVYYLNLL